MEILTVLAGLFLIVCLCVPFYVAGIYNQTKKTAQATERLADFFSDRNVEIGHRK
jgi:hypothetical protein